MFHVLICGFLILVVLLQRGKGQDFASTFGGGGTQTTFGARSGTTMLHKLTTIAAALFMVNSLALTILLSRPDSVITRDAIESETPAPPAAPLPVTPPAVPAPAEGVAPAEDAAPDPAAP